MNPVAELRPSASCQSKENLKMTRRFAVALAALATTLVLAAALPAMASAAPPWWQILDGSRPSNLWKPTDSIQEITTTMGFPGSPSEGVVQKLEIQGKPIGCLGSETFFGNLGCEAFVQAPATATAAQLKTLLEPIYGSDVEVTGGPVG